MAGARFFYEPGTYAGRAYPDSGYLFPVRHEVELVADHPVTAGLDGGFTLDDELYLLPLLEQDVVPLLRSRHRFVEEEFYSAAEALRGRMRSREGWHHPPGTDLVAWARRCGNSPVVTILAGNGPETFGHAGFRRLLRNAIDWVTGEAARLGAGPR